MTLLRNETFVKLNFSKRNKKFLEMELFPNEILQNVTHSIKIYKLILI